MTRGLARSLGALLLAAAASPAPAQVETQLDRWRGLPVGLAVPGSVASAEDPTALSVNPAGVGFVRGAAFQYYFEGGRSGSDRAAHGVWLALPLGTLVPALSLEWMSPGEGRGPRYQKTGLGLALAMEQVFSLGYSWNWWSSPDPGLDNLFSMDLGLTLRPWRHLSIGASALGLEGRLAGQRLPVRYDMGAATRFLGDQLTLSGDLLANDEGKGSFRVTHAAAGISIESSFGVALQAQVLLPLRSGETGPDGATAFQVSVAPFNQPHVGATLGTGSIGDSGKSEATNIFGVRLSAEGYRSAPIPTFVQVVDLAGALTPPTGLAALFAGERDRYGTLLRRLERLRADPRVVAVVAKVDALGIGDGRVEELRAALAGIRERKPVVAYLVGGEMREYLLASAAGEVFAPPGALLPIVGPSSTRLYLKDGLAKLGLAFEAVAVGRFKNAPDPLTRSDMSQAEHEVVSALLDARAGRQVRLIAESRGLPEARVRQLVDGGVFTAQEAAAAKLIDGVLWPDELEERVRNRHGGAALMKDFDDSRHREAERWGPRPYLAVVRVEGAIARGRSRSDPFGGSAIAGSESISSLVRGLAEDGACRAIVVRIDSPGGDGFASELIWRELARARKKGKPVVASMGDTAASGGYLVAVGADAIVAEPSTLTGSIGVFALKPDLSGLLDKLAVRSVSEQRGSMARIDSPLKAWTPEERRAIERQVSAFYQAFVDKVAEGRGLGRAEVDAVAQGHVWTGEQALSRHLVDRLGSLADALALARQRAGLPEDVEVWRLEPTADLAERVASGLETLSADRSALRAAVAKLPELQAAAVLAEMGPILALPPTWVLGVR